MGNGVINPGVVPDEIALQYSRSRDAFDRLFHRLLQTHKGKYVMIQGNALSASGDSYEALLEVCESEHLTPGTYTIQFVRDPEEQD